MAVSFAAVWRKIRFLIPAFLYYVLIFILSSQPRIHLPIAFPLIDKVLHLILYTGFGICLAFGLARLDRRKAVETRARVLVDQQKRLAGVEIRHVWAVVQSLPVTGD